MGDRDGYDDLDTEDGTTGRGSTRKQLADSTTWTTVAVWLFMIAFVILMALLVARIRQWPIDLCCADTATVSQTTVSYQETPTITDCDLSDTCNIQSWNSTLELLSDTSTQIGTALGTCSQLGPDAIADGILYMCTKMFEFDGSGDVPAGMVISQGKYFVPTNQTLATSFRTSVFAITGGTGTWYSKPSGGTVTFTTQALQVTQQGSVVFNRVA